MSKQTVLDDALKSIEKQFGKGAIMKLWSGWSLGTINTFHSGSFQLDSILWWWFPEWRVVEIYGPESSWKTTIALHAIAEVQKKWETAAFIDAEHALDPEYARKLGVDIDNLLLAQPDYGEQALQIAEELAKSWAIKLIVIDSVAAMVPRAEVEGDMGDSHMGLQARMMSQWLRKLTSILAKTGTTIIFINQIRMKIGVMFGNPETTTWGNALKFYASQRLEIRKGDKIEENKEQVGYYAKVKVVKNKVAPPFKNCEIPVRWTMGFDHATDLVEAGILLEVISRAWAFYTIGDQKVQGKDNLVKLLGQDEKMRTELEHTVVMAIKEMRMGKKAVPVTVGEFEEGELGEEVDMDEEV
jgi:recombination protein RecA